MQKREERSLALAGLIQSCHLISGVAKTGMISQDSLTCCLDTIFVTNPDQTLDVYKSEGSIRTGVRLITEILGAFKIREHSDTVHCALSVLSLEKRMRQTPKIMLSVSQGIFAIQQYRDLSGGSVSDEEIISRLSKLYEETASIAGPRIRIRGKQKYLANSLNTSKIRALLLAAIRSAVLWHQLGGNRVQLLIGRNKLLKATNRVSKLIS